VLEEAVSTTDDGGRSPLRRKSRDPSSWFRSRSDARERRLLHGEVDLLLQQLGGILTHPFHSVVTRHDSMELDHAAAAAIQHRRRTNISGKKNFGVAGLKASAMDENVHDREMKVLIWRRFAQMLVAVLTDEHRFPDD